MKLQSICRFHCLQLNLAFLLHQLHQLKDMRFMEKGTWRVNLEAVARQVELAKHTEKLCYYGCL